MKKISVLALVLSLLPVVAQAQAPAPAGDGKSQNIQTADTGWQTICRPNAKDRAKQDCSVVHETFTTNDRLRIAAIEIVKAEKGRVMVLSAPMGVSLKDGIEISVDGANKQQASFTGCQNNGCFASIEIADKTLDVIKKGKALSVGFSDAQGNKVKADIALLGFTAAITRAE